MFQNFVKLSEDGSRKISSNFQVTANKPIRALDKCGNVACKPIVNTEVLCEIMIGHD